MQNNNYPQLTGWDPLESKLDPEMISANQKRSIKNILKSYVGSFDAFSELIQNCLDAVDKQYSASKEAADLDYQRKLWITLNIQDNSFTIIDNGTGFKLEEFQHFLAPNISFKDTPKSRGNKGVGATYIAYGFNHLELGTKSEDFSFYGEIRNGRDWIEDNVGVVARPVIRAKNPNNKTFDTLERGSIFVLRFGAQLAKPRTLSWYQANNADQWQFLLRAKTPLGVVSLPSLDHSDIQYELTVVDKDGVSSSVSNFTNYLYPHLYITGSKNIEDVRAEQLKIQRKGGDISKLPSKFYGLKGVYEVFSTDFLSELYSDPKSKDELELIKRHEVSAYGYFAYSTAVWDALNDSVANLRKGFRVLKGGIQMANNSMLQGDLLVIPLTKNIGYQNQTHIIIHFHNTDPDLGRKGFQPDIKLLADNISVNIVNHLTGWRRLLLTDKGNKPDLAQELSLHEWKIREEQFEISNPLSISNPNFFNPVNQISISSEPQSEQDVIVLFNQLLAGGVIRGIKLLSTSQKKQYDGLFRFVIEPPQENHIYNSISNPLGVPVESYKTAKSIPYVLEYKFNLDALIYEFENGEKRLRDINLAVVWTLGKEWEKDYEILSLLDINNLHRRDSHGVTHKLFGTNGISFDVIALQDLLEYLNDFENSQVRQESYSSL